MPKSAREKNGISEAPSAGEHSQQTLHVGMVLTSGAFSSSSLRVRNWRVVKMVKDVCWEFAPPVRQSCM
ncbi:hypothetical protein JTE90_017381 [Oedothorax gibbosus]|uniref:Uncharacterized protein n=1 Tax=Oedothorax gibbosus TaxID=931172 RepID=A0AAV6VR30_9ARAC|nr:hypothetical protein JTE90_017381 [Oedothorax gibbosus]